MTRIIAKGVKDGKPLTVVWEDGDMYFNVDQDYFLQDELERLLEKPRAVGGTYHPPKDSPMNAWNILKQYFFDSPVEVEIDGDIGEIPYEEGVIY